MEFTGTSAVRRHRLRGGNATWLLDALVRVYRGYLDRYLYNSTGRQCWWQIDDRDGMEFGISGHGCRPTISSAMYGEADAIVQLAGIVGNTSIAAEFESWREFSRSATLDQLWNPQIGHFVTIPLPAPDGVPQPKPYAYVQASERCNLTQVRATNRTVGVRELFGFSPWYFSEGVWQYLQLRCLMELWQETSR